LIVSVGAIEVWLDVEDIDDVPEEQPTMKTSNRPSKPTPE
jgi:hypothetical protein